MKCKKLKPKHLHTRAYRGRLIKDYGFRNIIKGFRKKYPSLDIESDMPVKVTKHQYDLGQNRKIEIYRFPGKKKKIGALYSSMDKGWMFFNEEGDCIDIDKTLRKIKTKE